jgi:hypothetical protein
VIDLDPGMAFGSGTHASTQLVLEELQRLADDGLEPDRILDVGCGSGILSIAAVKRRCVRPTPWVNDETHQTGTSVRVARAARSDYPAFTFTFTFAFAFTFLTHLQLELLELARFVA